MDVTERIDWLTLGESIVKDFFRSNGIGLAFLWESCQHRFGPKEQERV
jgi:hypothetical protein